MFRLEFQCVKVEVARADGDTSVSNGFYVHVHDWLLFVNVQTRSGYLFISIDLLHFIGKLSYILLGLSRSPGCTA